MTLLEQLIQQYSAKTYNELLTLPTHIQLELPELEALKETIEFINIPCEEAMQKIVFRHVFWETQDEAIKSYTQHFLFTGLSQEKAEKKAIKLISKVLEQGLDFSGKGLPKSVVSAMHQMREEHPETAFPFLPPFYAPHLKFKSATFSDGFYKKNDNTFITIKDQLLKEMDDL